MLAVARYFNSIGFPWVVFLDSSSPPLHSAHNGRLDSTGPLRTRAYQTRFELPI